MKCDSLEPCEEKGLVRSYLLGADKCATKKTALYCWENCPGDWGENHEGAKDEDVPLCLCAGHLKTFVDRGGTAGRYPKLFVTPTKRERGARARGRSPAAQHRHCCLVETIC